MEEVDADETVSELQPTNMTSTPENAHSQSNKEAMRYVIIPPHKSIQTYGSGAIPVPEFVRPMKAARGTSPCNDEDQADDMILDSVIEKTKQ